MLKLSRGFVLYYENKQVPVAIDTAKEIAKALKTTVEMLTTDLCLILVPKRWANIYDDLHTRVLVDEVVGYDAKEKAVAYYKVLKAREEEAAA